MSLFKSNTAPKEDREPRYHVVVSDRSAAYSLAGALPRDEAIGVFAERVERCGYPPDGPVRLRVIGEQEYAALESAR